MRGFRAVHVNSTKLRTRADKQIARYAVRRGMILVTNNTRDFERMYRGRRLHPGLVFLVSDTEAGLARESQLMLLDAALDEILREEPIQEIILVKQTSPDTEGRDIVVARLELPPHE